VGVEPFGGFDMSGTGPKAGGNEHLLAFMTRVEAAPPADSVGVHEQTHTSRPLSAVVLWTDAPVEHRATVIGRWLELLLKGAQPVGVRNAIAVRLGLQPPRRFLLDAEGTVSVARVVAAGLRAQPEEAERLADELVEAVRAVLKAAAEIGRHPTLPVDGQTNFMTWDTPRGIGLVAADETASPALFAGMFAGALLAGNGVVLVPPAQLLPLAEMLAGTVVAAGVPAGSLDTALGGPEAAVRLAGEPVHFAVTAMSPVNTRRIHDALGVAHEDRGPDWLKALISMDDGLRPGEPGFLKQFALPKAVAIRTLRHGAVLEL
jgi:delta 1-pyrroline-5-carboxylate dehydrogenase